MNRFFLFLLLLLPCVSSGRFLHAEDRGIPLLEEAFRQYSLKAGLLVQGEVMTAEIPCGKDLCLRFGLRNVPRDAAIKQLAQLASGFGYGAIVEEMRVRASRDNYLEVSVFVVARTDRRAAEVEGLTARAEELSAFLRVLARMSDAYREEFNPLKVAKDRRLYFIDEFSVFDGGQRMGARLLGPSMSQSPERRGKASPAEGFRITVRRDGQVETGPFAGWQSFRVDWERQ
ncbi:MAG: hypothetical protein FJ109_07180 [Deltaproteobacteria bacterium]|nr:hypothetical protein [Deltaproteobacteria bacterium]